MLYVYNDMFLSGWGKAPNGSYVISDYPIKRDEFKLLFKVNKWSEITHLLGGSGRHICYWKEDGWDYLVTSVGNSLVINPEPRNTWSISHNVDKVKAREELGISL